MYLKTDQIVIEIDGTFLRSFSTSDPQFILDPDAIQGWYDGPATRRSAAPRSNGWGDFPEKSEQGSRTITLSGTARARSATDLLKLRDELVGLFADGAYRNMRVTTRDGARNATVGIESSPSWIRQGDSLAVWKLDLYAPDPRVYSEEHGPLPLGGGTPPTGLSYPISYPMNYGNSVDRSQGFIGNAGNTEAWPKFVAKGNMPYGFVIHNNAGKTVRYLGMVTTAAPVTIDMSTGTASQNGIDRTSLVDIRDWFSIPAGGSISPAFDPIQNGILPVAAASCAILYRDTWI